ncbi:hypothetical protein RJ639_039853 [Escallonia herrerae]|uniref:Glutamate receptor n=1 Tax=Escallonia herrerae TaxID=1293975 RepID=A0AA89B6W6_9ASTE|nr:hypothetical protein RJ639_039853 [Escallonia herrerae]
MEIAIDDFTRDTNQILVLHIRNSQSKPMLAGLAARELIDTLKVKAILGPHTWKEAVSIADVGSQAHIPTLSLADSIPKWALQQWPFFVQASPSNYAQMKAVAAIIQSWGQRRVTFVYEDVDSSSIRVTSHLSDALNKVGAEISHLIALPPLTSSYSKELEKHKQEQGTTFVVHTSLASAVRLFHTAKRMRMVGKDNLWVVTSAVTDLLHSLNTTTLSSMQGIIGVRSYFPESKPQFQDFSKRFRQKFCTEYPEEENYEPGIFAVQAYDATSMVALAVNGSNMTSGGGQNLLQHISRVNFNGLTGKVQFRERKFSTARQFQIVNVFGKSYIGLSPSGLGFPGTDDESTTYCSIQYLGQVFCSREQFRPTQTRQSLPTTLKVGVPHRSNFKQFVNTDNKDHYTGFSIEVFREVMKGFPDLRYEFISFSNGSYDDMVEQVYKKVFDAVAGDVTILANRSRHADFTQPYTASGLEMIVSLQPHVPNAGWLFLKPFTTAMWVVIACITVYNGFVVWLIERNHSNELEGFALNQVGTLLWLGFTTLFSSPGDKLHSNLSRMTMVIWLFVALVITQSYTASFASMLTAQRLEPKISSIETLKKMNLSVGYCENSFLNNYLTNVLGFESNKLVEFDSTEESAKALRSGKIGALFLGVPKANLFLSQYCKSFTRAGETYKVGGFGFAFSKGFPKVDDINKALLNVSESGKLRELEKEYIVSEKCVDAELRTIENATLGLQNFWVLFVLTGGTSTASLAVYVALGLRKRCNSMLDEHKSVSTFILAAVTNLWRQRRWFSSRVGDAESFGSPPNT